MCTACVVSFEELLHVINLALFDHQQSPPCIPEPSSEAALPSVSRKVCITCDALFGVPSCMRLLYLCEARFGVVAQIIV